MNDKELKKLELEATKLLKQGRKEFAKYRRSLLDIIYKLSLEDLKKLGEFLTTLNR